MKTVSYLSIILVFVFCCSVFAAPKSVNYFDSVHRNITVTANSADYVTITASRLISVNEVDKMILTYENQINALYVVIEDLRLKQAAINQVK